MSANKWILVTLITTLLTACGGNQNQAPLPGDGSYDSQLPPAPMSDEGYGIEGTGGIQGVLPSPIPSGGSQSTAFTLKGLVAGLDGKPIVGAKVSIGSQTTLTLDNGTFEITGITDSQIWVDVTKEGFDPISRYNIAFAADKSIADKDFKLAVASASTDGTPGTGSSATATFTHEASFSGTRFASVSAMVVEGDSVYVLGVIDKTFWFDRNAVVVFSASSGEETHRINNGLFSKFPKDCDTLAYENGQVSVSNGTTRYTFDADGAFVKKTNGSGFAAIREVSDADRKIAYSIKGSNKIAVKFDGKDGEHALGEVGNARAIGLDGSGKLLILDDSKKAIHQFSYKP